MKLKELKERQGGGGYILRAAEDIPGFAKKGAPLYGNCDDLTVVNWLYQPLNGIYTVYLKEGVNE